MDSAEKSSLIVGFLVGILVTAFMVFIVGAIIDAKKNNDSEIMRIEYKNENGTDSQSIHI